MKCKQSLEFFLSENKLRETSKFNPFLKHILAEDLTILNCECKHLLFFYPRLVKYASFLVLLKTLFLRYTSFDECKVAYCHRLPVFPNNAEYVIFQPAQKRFKNVASTLLFTLCERFWSIIFGKFI